MPARDLFPVFRFVVEWGGERIGFSEVTGLAEEAQAIEYRGGRMPGLRRFSKITLKRGVSRGSDFSRWLSTVRPDVVQRRDLVIHLIDEARKPAMTWKVRSAFPVKVEGPSLDSSGNEAAIESIELSHEGIEVQEEAEASPAGSDLPARLLRTERDWDDLVLPAATLEQLDEVKRSIGHGPGFPCLFHGAPGTGKTLAASLLGKHAGRDVYRVDLGRVASKYIGETEKNLAKVFDLAEQGGAILFLDEADALFGRRTGVRDAHDRFANLETGFLLQRTEDFEGVVILSADLKDNIDAAFLRRLRFVVHFPMPGPAERLRLWRAAFPREAQPEPAVDLAAIAGKHELSGGAIMNAARYASLAALARGDGAVRAGDLEEGLKRLR